MYTIPRIHNVMYKLLAMHVTVRIVTLYHIQCMQVWPCRPLQCVLLHNTLRLAVYLLPLHYNLLHNSSAMHLICVCYICIIQIICVCYIRTDITYYICFISVLYPFYIRIIHLTCVCYMCVL